MYYTKLNIICQYSKNALLWGLFTAIAACPLYAVGQAGQFDASPTPNVAPKEMPKDPAPSSINQTGMQKVTDAIMNQLGKKIKQEQKRAETMVAQSKKEAADFINKKEIEALSQAILLKKDDKGNDIYKAERKRIKGVFDAIRAEVNAVIDEAFDRSCGRAADKINALSSTTEEYILNIIKNESAQAVIDAKCSIDNINTIATAYITKRLAATIITDDMAFIAGTDGTGGKLKEARENIKKIDVIIADLADDTYFLGIGKKIRDNSIKVLSDINKQLRLIDKNLLEIHNDELGKMKMGIVNNTIKEKEVKAAFNNVKKKLEAIQNSITLISNDLNGDSKESEDLRAGAQRKEIDLLEYKRLIVNLEKEIARKIEAVQRLADSENIKDLYKVLPNKDVDIHDPFTLPPRMPITTPSPGGPMTADVPDHDDREAERQDLIKSITALQKANAALRQKLNKK